MPERYEETITDLQKSWQRLKHNISLHRKRYGDDCETILIRLGQIGLDASKDETFSLIEPGLTRKSFDEVACRSWILQSLYTYHLSNAPNATFLGEPEVIKYHSLKELLQTLLPKTEEYLQRVDSPATNISALDIAEFDFLRNAVETGLLSTAYKIAANNFAIEMVRGIHHCLDRESLDSSDCKSGLHKADVALEAIEEAQDCYRACEIYVEHGLFGGFKPEKILFSKEEIQRVKELLFFKETAIEFKQAYHLHMNGHYVLDASGSVCGVTRLPMQYIAEKLQKNGYDFNAVETFEKFGTNIDTFWSCYETERRNVANSKVHKKLLNPHLKR